MRSFKLLFFILLLSIGTSSFQAIGGQTVKSSGTAAAVRVSKHAKVYACPECEVASMKAGKCSMCGKKMETVSANLGYGCADCHVFSAKAGKCPKCGKAMAKAAETFACEHCKTSSSKPGKCPKCGKALKKYDMKVA